MLRFSSLLLAALVLTGCVSERTTNPSRTATEQLLISSAADRAAARLKLNLPRGTRLYIDASDFGGTDSKGPLADARYAVATITDDFLRQGYAVVPTRKAADVVVALRSGALSVNDRKTLVGIPSLNVPVPLTGVVTTPEIALFNEDVSRGIAKFAATGYDARDGLLRASTGPKIGTATHIHKVFLFFFGGTQNDLEPKAVNKFK